MYEARDAERDTLIATLRAERDEARELSGLTWTAPDVDAIGRWAEENGASGIRERMNRLFRRAATSEERVRQLLNEADRVGQDHHAVAAEAALAAVVAERDEARTDRDALLAATRFKPGPLGDGPPRQVVLDDVGGLRGAMVEARRDARRAQSDADLWTMRMLEEWPGDTLLLRLWRQRREATKQARAAEAALAAAQARIAEMERDRAALRKALEVAAVRFEDIAKGRAFQPCLHAATGAQEARSAHHPEETHDERTS